MRGAGSATPLTGRASASQRQVDRAIAGEPEPEPKEKGGECGPLSACTRPSAAVALTRVSARPDKGKGGGGDVVVIGNDSDGDGAGEQDEWEEVDVGEQEPQGTNLPPVNS